MEAEANINELVFSNIMGSFSIYLLPGELGTTTYNRQTIVRILELKKPLIPIKPKSRK